MAILEHDRVGATADDLFLVDPSVRLRRRVTTIVVCSRTALVVGLILAWELSSDRLIPEFWISRPSAVASAGIEFWQEGQLLPALRATMVETALGFGLGAAIGILVGLFFGVSQTVARILDPFLVALNSIPRVALIPLFILWFGIGLETKVLFAATLVFFPVFTNTFSGAREVDRDLVDVIRVMGASRSQTLRKVLVPSALVWVFAGLKMSVPFALIGAVIAEMFTADEGLGYLISVSANQYDTAASFAAILLTTLVGLGLTYAVAAIESRTIGWRQTSG